MIYREHQRGLVFPMPANTSVLPALERLESTLTVDQQDAALLFSARGEALDRLLNVASALRDEGLRRAGRPGIITTEPYCNAESIRKRSVRPAGNFGQSANRTFPISHPVFRERQTMIASVPQEKLRCARGQIIIVDCDSIHGH